MNNILRYILTIPLLTLGFDLFSQLNLIHQNGFGGNMIEYPINFNPTNKLLLIKSYSGANGNKGLSSLGSSDIWMLKLDEQLNKVSEFVFGGNSIEDPLGLVTIGNSHYLFASSCSGISGNKTVANYGSGTDCGDFWLLKLNEQYQILDQWGYGTSKDEFARGIIAHNDRLLLFGNSGGDIEYDKSDICRGAKDAWVICVDTNGNKIWDKTYGHTGIETFYKALILPDGYLFAGQSDSNIGNEKSENCYGQNDIWVVKTDFDGNKVWDKTIGSIVYDEITDLHYYQNEIFIVGITNDPTGSGNLGIMVENNTDDGVLVKVNPINGNIISINSYDHTIRSIKIISEKKILFTGFNYETKNTWIGCLDSSLNVTEEIFLGTIENDVPIEITFSNNIFHVVICTKGGVSGDKTSPNYGLEDTWILAFDITLSNNELSLMPDFKIYPNPTTDFIKINLPNDHYNQVQIVDMQGRVITEMPVHNNFEQIIDVSNYKTGTYFIKAKMQNGISVSKKFVKF